MSPCALARPQPPRPMLFSRTIHTIDSHTEGNPTRVIVGGVPTPPGDDLLQRRAWLAAHDDGLRRLLNFEPRGSGLMCSVLLMPPVTADADFSVIIMEQDEYVPMCGHCIIGTATTVVAAGMAPATGPITTVRFDTPAGLVRCDVEVKDNRVGAVSFTNVESFSLIDEAKLDVAGYGEIPVSVSYGGDFYAIIDADALGVALRPDNDARMIDAANAIRAAMAAQIKTVHPERPDIDSCYQVLFTSKDAKTGDYKQTIVCPPGSLDRSPCGTGTSARIAHLFARGEIGLNEPKTFEGPLGTCFTGVVTASENRGGRAWITPRITGRAYITGFNQYVLDPMDPLPQGYRIGPAPREH